MTPESIVMHSGSIVFNGSFLTLIPVMFVGGTYILLDHFDPRAVTEVIKNEQVTHTILVPSQIVSCLNLEEFKQENLKSLEYILSVGAPLLLEHKEELDRRTPNVFYELYGLTEGFMTILDKTEFRKKAGSVGAAPQLMEIKIVDDFGQELPDGQIGEIVGKSPLLMTEYYKNPSKTAEAIKDGWLMTGDVGYLDEDGYLFLTGRKKDLIISGGVNVYPIDIEEVIARHPAIQDVSVFGVNHDEWGETPIAAVILKNGFRVQTHEIKKFANDNLEARYQKVTDVFFVADFPKNVAGKILKRELKENYLNG
jgi:acyl-CoA synthetase (AMP-forming)/AMP-acid ligase II